MVCLFDPDDAPAVCDLESKETCSNSSIKSARREDLAEPLYYDVEDNQSEKHITEINESFFNSELADKSPTVCKSK